MSVLAEQQPDTPGTVDDLVGRILEATLGTVDLVSIYLGDRLGWYRSLRDDGPATSGQLAARTGTQPRYAREWLEQQAVTGLLTIEPETYDGPAEDRRYVLPDATAEVLTNEHSLTYLAPLGRLFVAVSGKLPELLHAYRHGGGIGWMEYGVDAREGQADLNRPWFEHALADALHGVPALQETLQKPGARIADIGCGGGWSTIALARAYPEATVDGYDIDPPSVELARSNAKAVGMDDRIAFHSGDAAAMPDTGYDLVFAFECIHDMPQPVEVLGAARRALRPGGSVVVMDEAVGESFCAPGDIMERLMYGFSLSVCLPDGMSHQPTVATGTVMRPGKLWDYGRNAGFKKLEILPIEDFGFWRFYHLTT